MKILTRGIYLVVFCLPLYLVRFNIFNIPTTVLELMIYMLFLVWLIKGFDFKEFRKTIKENRLLFVAVFLILLGVSLATLHSWNPRLSAGIWKAWFVDPVLFFLVFVSIIKSSKEIKNIFYSLVFSGFFVAVVSLTYLFLGRFNSEGRLQGFYNSPNYLAMYLAPILIIVLGYYFFASGLKTRPKTTSQNIFIVFNCLFLILAILFTKSFGAWIGILGAVGFGLILWSFKEKKKKTAIIIIVLLAILCVSIYFIKFNSLQGKLSINSRVEIWQRALDAVIMYPVIGIGPGTFEDFFPQYPLWGVPQPHNLYLAFLLQTGVFGFIGFILILIWFFKTGIKNQNLEITNIILMSVMVYVLIHGLVDTTYWKNDLSVMFWIFVGLMVILKESNYLKIEN